jgi:BirA family biotin operon repressor/biotin-[acetyl-CoA-carboxylase] ligase
LPITASRGRIEAVYETWTGGYRLQVTPVNGLSAGRIKAALRAQVFGQRLVVLAQAGSTNDVAADLAARGAPEGTVVLADVQTAGRGRLGRRWVAPPGTCLLCSILFRPDLPPAQAQQLTMLCALAASDAVEEVGGLGVALKWPNDLVVKSRVSNPKAQSPKLKPQRWRKLAGVLTETGVMGPVKAQRPKPEAQPWRLEYVIVGIGINANVSVGDLPGLAPDATSILAETGRMVDRVVLLATLLAGVEARYARLRAGESPRAEWAARLATLGQHVQALTATGTLVGIAEAVNEDGALLLRTSDGALHRLLAGDVTLAQQ